MPIYNRDLPWADSQKELCSFSWHKDESQVKVHMINSQLMEDPATEIEEYSKKSRQMTGMWTMGWRPEARVGQ